ncbi:DUF6113 family protein [Streptomyces sp. LE64]|uniref:DUF6113 family protein n=1 Tax=Streptomyces sp. LE64 TaxID=3448653 RepID=UPI004041AB1C
MSATPGGAAPTGRAATADLPGGFLLQGPPSAGRIAAYLLLFVLGLLIGGAGSLVQGAWFPGGLLLALLGTGGLFLGGGRAVGTRGGAVAPAAGWLVAVILLTSSRPEGDFLYATGAGTYVYLLGGIALAVMCATLVRSVQPGSAPARLGK